MDYQGVEITWCADLSLKLDGRPFEGENTIFSKYSVPYLRIPLLYFATTVLHLRKKNI